jgi:hypothetical protein
MRDITSDRLALENRSGTKDCLYITAGGHITTEKGNMIGRGKAVVGSKPVVIARQTNMTTENEFDKLFMFYIRTTIPVADLVAWLRNGPSQPESRWRTRKGSAQ